MISSDFLSMAISVDVIIITDTHDDAGDGPHHIHGEGMFLVNNVNHLRLFKDMRFFYENKSSKL